MIVWIDKRLTWLYGLIKDWHDCMDSYNHVINFFLCKYNNRCGNIEIYRLSLGKFSVKNLLVCTKSFLFLMFFFPVDYNHDWKRISKLFVYWYLTRHGNLIFRTIQRKICVLNDVIFMNLALTILVIFVYFWPKKSMENM
jgi:hypothetical protein